MGWAAIARELRVQSAGVPVELREGQARLKRAGWCARSGGVNLRQGEGIARPAHRYLAPGYAVEPPTGP